MTQRGPLELRGPGRWSKTAAIVVLTVFMLVVGVSIAGLYAFAQARDAELARRRADARDLVKARLQDLRREVREGLVAHLAPAAAVKDAASLREFLTRADGDLVTSVVVMERGGIAWVDRRTLLDVPRDRLDRWVAEQARTLDAAGAAYQAVRRATASAHDDRGVAAALDAWCDLLESYPVVTKAVPGSATWPYSLTLVPELLDVANTAPRTAPEDRARLGRALRAATQAIRINRGLRDAKPEDIASSVGAANERIRTLIDASRSGGDDLAWEFERLAAATAALDDPAVGGAWRRAADSARQLLGSRPAAGRVLLQAAPPEIVALVVLPSTDGELAPLALARLDPTRLEAWIAAKAAAANVARLGAEIRVLGPARGSDGAALSVEPSDDATLLAEASLVDLEGAWNPPYRLRAHRIGEPLDLAPSGAWSHWLVLGLAALGIGVGGWVLVRLLTREVRLARIKADFVGNLSHELKTPITSIAMFTEMLRDGKMTSDADRTEAYEVLDTECKRLERTVARMLEMARREAGGSPYAMRIGDVRAPVRRALERFRRIVPDRGLRLDARLGVQPIRVRHDPEAIEDVVANLLSNAWKYRRGDAAHLSLVLEEVDRKARLTLTDDGIGIPRAERRRVFETFYRAEQLLTQNVSGTGLGLALVRTIVRGHGGRVKARSGPDGVGTAIEIVLPIARRPVEHDAEVTPNQRPRAAPREASETEAPSRTPSAPPRTRPTRTLDSR